jgi:hypothetical protein
MHGPFVPFSILYTRAVQLLDDEDLTRLDHFAASLQPEGVSSSESITHPHRLYELLCRGARLYFDINIPSALADPTVTYEFPNGSSRFDFGYCGMQDGAVADEAIDTADPQTDGLSDWYYSNQQIMCLLDDNNMF